MSCHAGLDISTDNLVLCIDAGNEKSYSTNIFPNPLDIYTWYFSKNGSGAGARCTLSQDTVTGKSPVGGVPMKMTISGDDPYTNSYNALTWNLSPSKNGDIWTISAWVKASVATTAEFYIFGCNSSGIWITAPNKTIAITTEWVRYDLTATFNTVGIEYVQIRLDGPNTSGTGINIWWDGLQLQRTAAVTSLLLPNANGSTIKDISNNGITGTLTNGAVYNYLNGGTIIFDGVNDYISIANNSLIRPASELTIEYIIKGNTPTSWNPILGYGNGNYVNGNYLMWVETGGGLHGLCRVNNIEYRCTPAQNISSTYIHVVYTMKCGDSIRPYFNGVASGTTTPIPVGSFTYNGTTLAYQVSGLGGSWLNGSIPLVKIYNRALTATEVKQNFYATRGRFGI